MLLSKLISVQEFLIQFTGYSLNIVFMVRVGVLTQGYKWRTSCFAQKLQDDPFLIILVSRGEREVSCVKFRF